MCNSLAISDFFFPFLNIYPQIPPVCVLLLLLEMIINFYILTDFIPPIMQIIDVRKDYKFSQMSTSKITG